MSRAFNAARDLGHQSRLVLRPEVIGLVVQSGHNLHADSVLNLFCRHLCAYAAKADLPTGGGDGA